MIAQDSPASEDGTVTFGPQSSDQDNFDQKNYENLLKSETSSDNELTNGESQT